MNVGEKIFSVRFESDKFFAERKVEAQDAFMAVIRASIQLASEGGVNGDLCKFATEIHCTEYRIQEPAGECHDG